MAEQTNLVNWFEIPVNDLERAKRFYESVLGIELTMAEVGPLKMAWFPMVEGGCGASGSLVQAEGYTPSRGGTLVFLTADDIEGTLTKVRTNGGRTLLPKIGLGEYGFIAHFEDSEGNRVALHSNK